MPSEAPALIQVATISIDREHGQGHSPRRPRNLDRVPNAGPASAIRVAAPRPSVSLEEAERAIRAEIAYYRAHLHQGRDAASLHDLRLRSAEAMGLDVPTQTALDALLAALRFFAYPDSAPTLLALRERGIRLVVVSNWDFSLHERLAETGLTPLIDGALASAEVGSAKPDSAIFRAALRLAGTTPEQTWHVGDTPTADVRAPARPAFTRFSSRARAPGRPARSVRSRNSYPWPQLDQENNEYHGWLAPEAPSTAPPSRSRRRRTRSSRSGRRSWRWPPRCSSSADRRPAIALLAAADP